MSQHIKFSEIEIIDLLKAWAAITLAFGILMGGFSLSKLFIAMPIAGLTVGIGFLLHELAHKVVAQRYGLWAEFRSDDHMLIFAIIFSFFGFVFAAPGAVLIHGYHITKKQNGLISLAGPLTNLVLAVCFFILAHSSPVEIVQTIGMYGALINAWLGLFNMIPIWTDASRCCCF